MKLSADVSKLSRKRAGCRTARRKMISVGFINPDKTPVEATVAWTTDCSFETFRREGEDEAAFRARAHSECRAADPRPVPEPTIKTGEALGAPVEFGLTISARATMRLNASRVYACAPSRSSSLRALPLLAAD